MYPAQLRWTAMASCRSVLGALLNLPYPLPSSWRKLRASGPRTPEVSTATGMKWCVVDNSEYLAFFIPSACFATAPASLPARSMWDGAKVSGQVASQTKMRPLFQGRIVTPSDLFPSDLQIPTGSRWANILADPKDLLMMSCLDGQMSGLSSKTLPAM